MKFNASMFDDIKNARNNKTDSTYKDILKFEAGKTYLIRLVPNLDEPKKTIFHYFHHSWNSLSTNKFVTSICPTTFGETCPICSHAIKTYRSGSESEKEQNKLINRKENWLVNAYVVSDPQTADNVGKVKMLRYGRELAKIVDEAIDGEDSAEFGPKIFDVVNGCSLRIKCESRSGAANKKQFVSYSSSKFITESSLDIDNISDIHANIFNLEQVFKTASAPELQRMLEQHYFCTTDSVEDHSDDDIRDEPVVHTRPTHDSAIQSIFEGVKEAKAPVDKDDVSDELDDELRDILGKL